MGEFGAVLNNVIKASFAIVGAVTGFTLTKTFFAIQDLNIPQDLKAVVFLFASLCGAVAFYTIGHKIIGMILEVLDRIDASIQKLTLYELALSSIGLIAGLIVANLITLPINKIDIIGVPLSIITNVLFGCIGIGIAAGKKNEVIFDGFKGKDGELTGGRKISEPKILDTSVIIDGRIVDICKTGFLEGELIIPGFVLEELRHIADSADSLKRNRGRRGLDVLNILQKELEYPVSIDSTEITASVEVDDKLLILAKKLNGKVLTNDYNLSKVANFQGVTVLNINELANALKPISLPGEEMTVQVIKDGKENGQGIGYLDDGTMIVVDGGRKHMGESVGVTVTSVLQTAAGRMIFAKLKNQPEPKFHIERVI